MSALTEKHKNFLQMKLRATCNSGQLANLIQLDSFLDSGDGRPFQGGLLACNAAEAGQPCRSQVAHSAVISEC